jgi:hypothetical protein
VQGGERFFQKALSPLRSHISVSLLRYHRVEYEVNKAVVYKRMRLTFFTIMALSGEKDFFLAVDYKFRFTRDDKDRLRRGVVRMHTDRRAGRELSAQDSIKTVVKFLKVYITVSAVEAPYALLLKLVKIYHFTFLLLIYRQTRSAKRTPH